MPKEKNCSKSCEVYSRVVGFYRPTSLWNKGKKEEFKVRKTYNLSLIGNVIPNDLKEAN